MSTFGPLRVILTADAGLCGEIPDPAGNVLRYRVSAAPLKNGCWSLDLIRCDSGLSYHLLRQSHGPWQCSCPAFRYQTGVDADGRCKHGVFAARLYELLMYFREMARDESRL